MIIETIFTSAITSAATAARLSAAQAVQAANANALSLKRQNEAAAAAPKAQSAQPLRLAYDWRQSAKDAYTGGGS